MLVHIVSDQQSKISELRLPFGAKYRITSDLLGAKNNAPKQCDAIIIAADLRNADTIASLKEISVTFKSARRKIFVIDHKARLCAAQAYALGATHVLFNPVYHQSLFAALSDCAKTKEAASEAEQGARGTAAEGAASFAAMFSAVSNGDHIDLAEATHAARGISDMIAESGFSHWLETVRRHHEGTYQHCLLVTGTVAAFGLSLRLSKIDMERLYSAAMFHDIGKARIPLAVLDKPGRLDDHERALIETHPAAGYDALKATPGISCEILDAVRHHHEYLDGSGYPDGLCGTDISDIVRILTISDIFAALIEYRRYKPTLPRAEAYNILCGMRGRLEMPLVAAFKEVALNG